MQLRAWTSFEARDCDVSPAQDLVACQPQSEQKSLGPVLRRSSVWNSMGPLFAAKALRTRGHWPCCLRSADPWGSEALWLNRQRAEGPLARGL